MFLFVLLTNFILQLHISPFFLQVLSNTGKGLNNKLERKLYKEITWLIILIICAKILYKIPKQLITLLVY